MYIHILILVIVLAYINIQKGLDKSIPVKKYFSGIIIYLSLLSHLLLYCI